MILFKRAAALHAYLQKFTINSASIGFVPTMGALHKGHISLITTCKQIADKTVCSIFVNPAQFNNKADFNKYPVNLERDICLLEKAGCDVLFIPGESEIYPDGEAGSELFDLGYLDRILEGKYRPGHFQGVCMAVKKLLEIVAPAYVLAGRKDYQQCLVLQRLLDIADLATRLIVCPTVREHDGLAMSSRNVRLNAKERAVAPGIYRTLLYIKDHLQAGSLKCLKEMATDMLIGDGFRVEYIEIATSEELRILDTWDGREDITILAAVYLNEVRLIDNLQHTRENKD